MWGTRCAREAALGQKKRPPVAGWRPQHRKATAEPAELAENRFSLRALRSPRLLSTLEVEPEHHLRDPHEPSLRADRAEVRVADHIATRARERPNVNAVQQVQHLDLDLGALRAETQPLAEH